MIGVRQQRNESALHDALRKPDAMVGDAPG